MVMRFDPFRELDRLSNELFNGAQRRPAAMPMDAYREGITSTSASTCPASTPPASTSRWRRMS